MLTPAVLSSIFLVLQHLSLVSAQLSLPNPPFLPPNASWGAIPSSGGDPNSQWTTLLGDLLYFYEAQRSGRLPSSNRVSWRNDSCLNDGQDVNLDLSGGYYDAGDYIKCTFPLSFTLMSICWGALDFGEGYDKAEQTPYLDSMLRWGLDWMIKAHPENNTLYVQIADGNLDNAYWGGDQNIPTDRPSYQINDTSPGTDAAAAASAAFSACSLLYSNSTAFSNSTYLLSRASLQNDTYSSTLLQHAQQLYTFAVNATGGQTTYQTSVPAVGEAYSSSSYTDDLTFGALWLSWASNDSSLYADATDMYNNYSLGGADSGLDVFNWDGKAPGIPILGTQIANTMQDVWRSDLNATGWQNEAEMYLDSVVNGDGRGTLTGGGLLYYDGDSDDASLNPALNAAMLMIRYAPLASTEGKRTSYLDFASKQLNYVLGNNPMSAPYVVGVNPNSPSNPHSAMASGGNDISQIDTSPPQEAYVLYGAVVGGPDRHDKFWDIRSDWPETEVALDYNAPLLMLAAFHVASDTSDPHYTSLQAGAYQRPALHPCDEVFSCAPRLSKGAKIAMGVALGVTGLVVVGLSGYYVALFISQRRNQASVPDPTK